MTAFRAGVSAYQENLTVPAEQADWADYGARLSRYTLYRHLRNNTAYSDLDSYSTSFKQATQVYTHTRGIYNPVARLEKLIAAKTMGGMIDWQNLKTGAIPVTQADETLIEALLKILQWSKFGQNKTLYAREASTLGDCGLWVVDDPAHERVRIEVLHPAKIKDARFDELGNVKECIIEYERDWADPSSGKYKTVLYRMEVNTKDYRGKFATFKDNQPFAWQTDARNKPVEVWDNPYGFTPLVNVNFENVGHGFGANSFYASVPKINEVNDAASLLNDSIRRQVATPWYMAGVDAPDDLDFTDASGQRDDTRMVYGPAGSQPYPMTMPIDIANAAQNIQHLLSELERDMPVLALQRLREKGAEMSGVAIENAYSDASGVLKEAMGNLDDGLIRALQMCVSIGGFRRYPDFRAYSLDSYERGDLDFYIKPRDIFEDRFTRKERVDIIKNLPDNPAASNYILVNEMQMSEDDAQLIIAGQLAVDAQKQAQQFAQFGGNGNGIQVQPPAQLPAGQGAPQAQAPDDAGILADVQAILDGEMVA